MRRISFLILFALLACWTALAGASFANDGGAAPSEDVPLLATCTGSNVNLRTEPNKSGKILTRLSKGQTVYAIDTKNTGEKFPWVRVITNKGYKGWFYGQYCSFNKNATSAENRWKAAYESSVFFEADAILRITGQKGKKSALIESELKRGLGGYAEYKLTCPPLTLFCLEGNYKSHGLIAASVTSDKYRVAGLRVGDDISSEAAKSFGKMLKKVEGWEDGDDSLADGDNWWYQKAVVDVQPRPVRGFVVECENGKVKEIWWCVYLVD